MNGFENIAYLHLYNQFIVAVVMVVLYLNKNTRTPGSGFWTINIILYCFGIILNLIFNQGYHEVPILISRLPILIGSSFFALGLNIYLDKPFSMNFLYVYIIVVSISFIISIPINIGVSNIIFVSHSLIIGVMYLLIFRKRMFRRTAGIYHIIKVLFLLYSIYVFICLVKLNALLFGFYKQILVYSNLLTIGILTAVNYAIIILISIDRLFYHAHEAQKRKEEMMRFKQLSEIDVLTGLYNRRTVETIACELLKKAECSESIFTIFMIDINSFKMINDVNGHDIGDKVLAKFAEILNVQLIMMSSVPYGTQRIP